MSYSIRPLENQDYADVAQIINIIEAPWETNEEETRREDTAINDANGTLRHYVAVDFNNDKIVGHGVLRGWQPADHPQSFQLELRVNPSSQCHGIGTELWRSLQQELPQLQSTSIRAWIRDCHPHALAFARKHGFVELKRNALGA